MTEKELLKSLNNLKTIEPDKDYARTSRLIILSSKNTSNEGFSIKQSFNFAASIGMFAIFLFILTLGGISGTLKTFFLPSLPGIDNKSLVSEADTITQDIDIKLREIEYFESEKAIALANESNATRFINNETEIDDLLDEVIDY